VAPTTFPIARAHGFTLVEVMIAAMILIVGLLGTYSMVDQAQRTTLENRSRTTVLNLSREILEQARGLEYDGDLTPAKLLQQLRARPNLAGSIDSSGKWVVTRRGIPVTVTTTVCTFDDPMDGLSPVPPQDACPAAPAVPGAPVEINPDDFRRVALTLEWKVKNRPQRTTQSAQINNPSGGTGPRITNFPDPFVAQVTSGTSIPFTVSTTRAASVRWSVDDGVSAGDATGALASWTFSWNIGTVGVAPWTVDGTYTANVQPFDARGVPGERRAATVLLNRRVPLAPANVLGGRSDAGGGVIELEWTPNPERDVIGYRVYRTGSTNIKARICPPPAAGPDAVITTTACTDPDPGNQPLHHVYAVDRPTLGNPASGTREGDGTAITVSNSGTPRPDPPSALVGQIVNGRVQLAWTPPSGGQTPIFYRIYRDGVRIDRTATALPTFTDPVAMDGGARVYTVTSVNDRFNESVLSNAVTVGG
jgi:type II secretory pathway pseudopilin PulG